MMMGYGGFEGNAQTLRIVSQLEKKVIKAGEESPIERRCGLNLSYRQLASILKYDNPIPNKRETRKGTVKGYYLEDKPVVDDIKSAINGSRKLSEKFKTIECSIMDLADDIAYSTYDLEDSFKAGFLNPQKILMSSQDIYARVAEKVAAETNHPFSDSEAFDIFMEMFIGQIDEERYVEDKDMDDTFFAAKLANAVFMTSEVNVIAENGRSRTEFTSSLVGEFVNAVEFKLNSANTALSFVEVPLQVKQKIETLKRFSYEATIRSSRLKLTEHRGRDIVQSIFKALYSKGGEALLPDDQIELWQCAPNEQQKKRVICDFIAGMTDRYALEFYGRLYSDNPVSMFKTA